MSQKILYTGSSDLPVMYRSFIQNQAAEFDLLRSQR